MANIASLHKFFEIPPKVTNKIVLYLFITLLNKKLQYLAYDCLIYY